MSENQRIVWNCPQCDKQEFQPEDFRKHLREVHGVEPGTKGARETELCLDGGFGGLIVYRWTIGELHFFQSIQTFRTNAQKKRNEALRT